MMRTSLMQGICQKEKIVITEQQDEELHVPASEEEASTYLKNVWYDFCPPTKEDDIT